MKRIAFYSIIITGNPSIRIMSRSNSNLMPAGKTHTHTKAVLKLKGTTEIIIFNFGVGEESHTYA